MGVTGEGRDATSGGGPVETELRVEGRGTVRVVRVTDGVALTGGDGETWVARMTSDGEGWFGPVLTTRPSAGDPTPEALAAIGEAVAALDARQDPRPVTPP